MEARVNYLRQILERKRLEVTRRRRFANVVTSIASTFEADFNARFVRQPGCAPFAIAEIKHRSPSKGELVKRQSGGVAARALQYVDGGASVISVLCDSPGFGGTVLDVRRVRNALDATRHTQVPILFKEFVLDEIQLDWAHVMGARLVLLLVNALEPERLEAMVGAAYQRGLVPLVEAANDAELKIALQTSSSWVGVNARDLTNFNVDGGRALALIAKIPRDRIAVFMSGVNSKEGFDAISASRADGVLIGEALMRAPSPDLLLRSWLNVSS